MSDNVRNLFEVNQLAPTPELKAQYLEYLARELRSGDIELNRCVLIGDNPNGGMEVFPFGNTMDNAALVGLLEVAKLKAAL